ncbi:MAG: DUF2116 family Zn-ribbon domain-containing protein [Clostridium sp.]
MNIFKRIFLKLKEKELVSDVNKCIFCGKEIDEDKKYCSEDCENRHLQFQVKFAQLNGFRIDEMEEKFNKK